MTDRDFWTGLWDRGRIPFHWHRVQPLLAAHFAALGLAPGARVFLPLCGKSVDIGWLRARGFRVAGAELSPVAVAELFDQMGEAPEVTPTGPLVRHRARDVEIWAGDIFDLTAELLGPVDAVYDRAALIALPARVRARYAPHVEALTGTAPQLLLTAETEGADDGSGPPYFVPAAEVAALYGRGYRLERLADLDPHGNGDRDVAWHLAPRQGAPRGVPAVPSLAADRAPRQPGPFAPDLPERPVRSAPVRSGRP